MTSHARPGCLTGKRKISAAHAERLSALLHTVPVQKVLVAELGITAMDLHDALTGGLFGGPKAARLEAKIDAATERRRPETSAATSLVFLDFDGVLNSERFYRVKPNGVMGLDPEAVAILNTLIERTGAEVVVSSSWRIGDTVQGLTEKLVSVGFTGKVIGVTPDLFSRPRGEEIQAWLDAHPATHRRLVVIDDDADMVHLTRRLVQTRFATGLTAEDVDRAVEILESQNENGPGGESPEPSYTTNEVSDE